MTELIVVGAGPAGRALAHRAAGRRVAVTLIDPAPDRPWSATFGVFADDLPDWLPYDDVIACAADRFVVFTPERREVPRPYVTLSAAALQAALDLSAVEVVTGHVAAVTERSVRLDDGRVIDGDVVVDARGGAALGATAGAATIPRQTAYGVFVDRDAAEDTGPADAGMVLMDWRGAAGPAPTFGYRVDLGDGRRLVEETCLAGAPPVPFDELSARNTRRLRALDRPAPAADSGPSGARASKSPAEAAEFVDFPLYVDPRPWRRPAGALRFGAGGGLMHPATGYSIAVSLGAADTVAGAVARGDDPAAVLWTRRARWTFRLRMIGLAVLLGFDGDELTAFFDAFFRLPTARQRAYLGGRDDLRGTLATMWAVFRALPGRQQARLVTLTGRALVRRSAR
ncbi:MAG: lycopene cyclase family protein [Gordonia sp. (in: high G+C Gram-positive bacteria)]|uniref:lycopene cyclase family protein n=1 Tax=Gordonia sp. (in: high G+C Gram-positive bacteria) TaxID=84139 RepID=UPI0039E21665